MSWLRMEKKYHANLINVLKSWFTTPEQYSSLKILFFRGQLPDSRVALVGHFILPTRISIYLSIMHISPSRYLFCLSNYHQPESRLKVVTAWVIVLQSLVHNPYLVFKVDRLQRGNVGILKKNDSILNPISVLSDAILQNTFHLNVSLGDVNICGSLHFVGDIFGGKW